MNAPFEAIPDGEDPTPTPRASRSPATAGDRIVDWICTCVLDGFLHCACSHHPAHPDLAACLRDRRTQASTHDEVTGSE